MQLDQKVIFIGMEGCDPCNSCATVCTHVMYSEVAELPDAHAREGQEEYPAG
jgi:hypothetical protein